MLFDQQFVFRAQRGDYSKLALAEAICRRSTSARRAGTLYLLAGPDLVRTFLRSSAPGGFIDQEAQIVVLRGFRQTVKGVPCFQIAPHRFETGCDSDFVIR